MSRSHAARPAQRAGRSGRVAPGVCIGCTRGGLRAAAVHRPESCAPTYAPSPCRWLLNSVTSRLSVLDPPDARSIRDGCAVAQHGAFSQGGDRDVGRLARLPVDPRSAALILAAAEAAAASGCWSRRCPIPTRVSGPPTGGDRRASTLGSPTSLRLQIYLNLWRYLRSSEKRSGNAFRVCAAGVLHHLRIRNGRTSPTVAGIAGDSASESRRPEPADPPGACGAAAGCCRTSACAKAALGTRRRTPNSSSCSPGSVLTKPAGWWSIWWNQQAVRPVAAHRSHHRTHR